MKNFGYDYPMIIEDCIEQHIICEFKDTFKESWQEELNLFLDSFSTAHEEFKYSNQLAKFSPYEIDIIAIIDGSNTYNFIDIRNFPELCQALVNYFNKYMKLRAFS